MNKNLKISASSVMEHQYVQTIYSEFGNMQVKEQILIYFHTFHKAVSFHGAVKFQPQSFTLGLDKVAWLFNEH